MLARPNRLTRGSDYKTVVRRGKRCAAAHTVSHVLASPEHSTVRFGFIVGKRVGNAVVRNTVRRRLKALCAEALPQMGAGTDVVIRALPATANADYATLRTEVHRCLRRAA